VAQAHLNPDPLTLEHAALVADIEAFNAASLALAARLRRLAPIDASKIERGRTNSVATCIVCAGPAPRCRRGLCDACYKAWTRADRPDIHAFRVERLAALSVPTRGHVDPASTLGILARRSS
jgi:hypothetical protein